VGSGLHVIISKPQPTLLSVANNPPELENSPPLKKSTLIIAAGLFILNMTPVGAETDCSTVREEEGQSAYEACRSKRSEQETKDAITKFKEAQKDERDDIEERYDDWIDDLEDEKKDADRAFERIEDDEKDFLDDLKDDEANKGVLDAQKARLDAVKKERRAVKTYFDKRIKYLKKHEDLEKARMDIELATYELQKRQSRSQY